MVTPTQGNVIAAIDLCEYFVSKSTGEANAGGYVNFWQDANRTTPKLVYQQINNGGSPPTYIYTALPNPVALSGVGTFMDNNNNNISVYYFPYDAFGNIQQYYIEVFDSNMQSQFTREAWPPLWAIQSGSLTTVINTINTGRLTLTSGVPVTTTNVTAATTVYYTPYKGNGILLYNSGAWTPYIYTQISLAVPASTVQMYDVFAYPLNGAVTLAFIAWTNDTTRATALFLQDGIYVSNSNKSYRYLGSFRTTGTSGQTEDSVAKRYLWNYYNRVWRYCKVFETTASWQYTMSAYRQANNNAANQLEIVQGLLEDVIQINIYADWNNSAAGGGTGIATGLGLDSATVATYVARQQNANANQVGNNILNFSGYAPAIGWHYYAWLEASDATSTTTWYGTTFSANTGLLGQCFA